MTCRTAGGGDTSPAPSPAGRTAVRLLGAARARAALAPAGLREAALVVALYLVYTASRLLASDDATAARRRAGAVRALEGPLGVEHALNDVFVDHARLAVLADYWYATAHYVVTPLVLVWLFRTSRRLYVPARRVLFLATFVALACYLVLPTAPPRMVPGFTDVMALHADAGWWSGAASAPKGLGGLTNQLAAFPSLHAGWSLWVALAVSRATTNRWLRAAAWAHAVITAVVVVGTANHWVLDVVVGWAVVAAVWDVVVGSDPDLAGEGARASEAAVSPRGAGP